MKIMSNADKVIISLFDRTGTWSQPYVDAGYQVIRIDKQIEGIDVHDFCVEYISEELDLPPFVHGILAAVPCTEFAVSGSSHFKAKDADGRTAKALDLLDKTMAFVEYYTVTDQDVIDDGFPGLQWWVFENPVNRIGTLRPWVKDFGKFYFNPNDYGDPYTKKTELFGEFNREGLEALKMKPPVEPIPNYIRDMKGTGLERQNARAVTPPGFCQAWFKANP
jgi:hypothetical protein